MGFVLYVLTEDVLRPVGLFLVALKVIENHVHLNNALCINILFLYSFVFLNYLFSLLLKTLNFCLQKHFLINRMFNFYYRSELQHQTQRIGVWSSGLSQTQSFVGRF